MNRETTILNTPSGYVVELYKSVTGRDERAVQSAILSSAEMPSFKLGEGESREDLKNKVMSQLKLNPDLVSKQEDAMINCFVISVKKDGEDVAGDSVLDKVLDLPKSDYVAVVNKVNEIYEDSEFENKKKA